MRCTNGSWTFKTDKEVYSITIRDENIVNVQNGWEITDVSLLPLGTEDSNNITRMNITISRKTPNQVHGEWILQDGYYCGNCYYKLQTTSIPQYCPHCGAEMKVR